MAFGVFWGEEGGDNESILTGGDGDVAQLIKHQTGMPLRQVQFLGVARDFSLSPLPAQTLLQCLYNSHVQSHATNICVHIKIPGIGSHTLVWTHKNTACTVRSR